MATVIYEGSSRAVKDPYVLEVLCLCDGDQVSTDEFFRIRALDYNMSDAAHDLWQVHEDHILGNIFWREFVARLS